MAPALKEDVAWPLAKNDTHKQMLTLALAQEKADSDLPAAVAHFQTSTPPSADNGERSRAKRKKAQPVAQTRFPTATRCEKTEGFARFYLPSITWTKRLSNHSTSKYGPESPNTVPQSVQSFKDHLRAALAMRTTRAQHKCRPGPSHKQSTPGSTSCRKNKVFA